MVVGLCLPLVVASGCGDDGGEPEPEQISRRIAAGGKLTVQIVLPQGSGPGLELARNDLVEALARTTGAEPVEGDRLRVVVELVTQDSAVGSQGFRIHSTLGGLRIVATTERGAMAGIYGLIGDLGVRYYHPEETFFPSSPEAELVETYAGTAERPAFERRGFHEHTQHPIPASDYLLRPGGDGFRQAATRYLHWLARNRQNAMSFHLLNTLDLATWLPWIGDIVEEAHGLGIDVGAVASFADQQQHNFKLLDLASETPAADQIAVGLDVLLAAGFDFITFQIGTSEFTMPEEGAVLGWLDAAVGHIVAQHPDVTPYVWVHITCGLETATGGNFFHQPLEAPAELGAFVHTTMFYTLSDPAPVYDCEDFEHQLDFFDAAKGTRELVFFPETSWWLGFDNNVPLILPLTGLSRQRDITRVLADYDATGHVTFTSGREWTYWQYDHYLTQATWDASLTWEAYLDRIAPMYGDEGHRVATLLKQWTASQEKHLYKTNPEIWFYLAGELPQDEVGAQAGILARRPKIPFKEVLAYDDQTFEAWKARDLDLLAAMRVEYEALAQDLPASLSAGTEQQKMLYEELVASVDTWVARLRHAIALYEGVVAARAGDRPEAEKRLAEATAISAARIAVFQAREAGYRSPVELLARPKPESLTVYPYGYLWETSTGFFWTRRDEQLATLIAKHFAADDEAWSQAPAAVFVAEGPQIEMVVPADPVAAGILAGFIPRLVFAPLPVDAGGALTVLAGQDANANGKPDGESELPLTGPADAWAVPVDAWALSIVDNAGSELGELSLLDATFAATPTVAGTTVTALGLMTLDAEFESQALVAMVQSVAGIDDEGIETLLKQVFGIDPTAPLPARLPVGFLLTPEKVD